MFIVLELGGVHLGSYFYNTIKDRGGVIKKRTHEDLLIKIIRGAAQALEQFHKFDAIHGDIKYENFIVSLNQGRDENVVYSKLIDFNTAVVKDMKPIKNMEYIAEITKAPEIKGTNEVFYS
ncbi:unnamed protein product [Meloidogyne enterolobii]|uniref:Uncharacterized protein n=1 Tax=Meloidogyne enterolobii TaxID=390850 RepID=A0ACB1B8H4_MELEN